MPESRQSFFIFKKVKESKLMVAQRLNVVKSLISNGMYFSEGSNFTLVWGLNFYSGGLMFFSDGLNFYI